MINDLGPLNLPSIEKVETFNFYGYSMNAHDFEYYFSIFKKYKLEEEKVKFYFLYSNFSNNDADNRNYKQKYVKNCLNAIDKYLEWIN